MRQLTHREKSLALFFGLAIFVIINLFALAVLNRQNSMLEAQLSDLESTRQMHEILLDQQEEWLAKNALLEQEMPEYSSIGDAQTDLIESLSGSAKSYNLDVDPPNLDDPVQHPTHTEVSAVVKITGPIRSVVGWLFQLQQPTKFIAVSNFSLRSGKEAPEVIAEVRVARWFGLDESVASILNSNTGTGTAEPPPPADMVAPDKPAEPAEPTPATDEPAPEEAADVQPEEPAPAAESGAVIGQEPEPSAPPQEP